MNDANAYCGKDLDILHYQKGANLVAAVLVLYAWHAYGTSNDKVTLRVKIAYSIQRNNPMPVTLSAYCQTYLQHVMCNLRHIFAFKNLSFIACADITCLVARSCCERCLSKMAEKYHTPALNLFLTVGHLHTSSRHTSAPQACTPQHLKACTPQHLKYVHSA